MSQVQTDELTVLAAESAREAEVFITTVQDVARGDTPQAAIPLSLLALSQVLVMGARLGAIEDVVPDERFEPDAGPDPELEAVRSGLVAQLQGLDTYADLVDPLLSREVTEGSLSNDLVDICDALSHGLAHQRAGRAVEALWWWQFSYLSDWGERAAAALRVLQGILAHIRLDADPEAVAEAEFDALHP